jgi:glutamate synthase (NADPH/NADH) small chain
LGVEFAPGTNISGEAELARLEKEYAIIFIGVGLGEMRTLGIPGEQHPDVVNALEFIERYKTGGNLRVGRDVVVVGAGNTAIDAARAAVRLGAENVHILYRREEENMAAFQFEFEGAKREGVKFHWRTQPVAIHKSAAHLGIAAIECSRVNVLASGDGQKMEFVPDSSFELRCDMVIPAIGQSPLLEFLRACRGVRSEKGLVVVDRATGQTSHPQYFAGGDCVNGGREVVDAVADGKRAAMAIAKSLEVAHAQE